MGKNNSVKKIDEEQILKRFEYTVQEYIRFYDFYKNQEVSEENTEAFYVMLQTKLMILRKYDYNREDVYLSNVFDAIDKMYPEVGENINILREKFEKLNNYYMEVILSDGTSLNLYKAIEDVMYGLYLHADPDKIERLLKTNKNVYLMAVKEYITVLERKSREKFFMSALETRIQIIYLNHHWRRWMAWKKKHLWALKPCVIRIIWHLVNLYLTVFSVILLTELMTFRSMEEY